MTLDGEITEVTTPPNQANSHRCITIWLPETEEHVEMTFLVEDFQKAGLGEGDKVTVKVDKKFDVDAMAQDLFKGKI